MLYSKKIYAVTANVMIMALFIFLLLNPRIAEQSTLIGLMFSLRVIIPALFVFIVMSRMLFPEILRISSGRCVEAVMLGAGLLCGFPVGATLGGWLFEQGLITKRQGEYLCTFTNNASISFVLSFIGVNVLGCIAWGWVIFGFQLVAAIICAVVFRYLMLEPHERKIVIPRQQIQSVSLPQAISDSIGVMANICACIVVFTCFGEVAARLLPEGAALSALVKGFLEFSGGIDACRNLAFDEALFLISVMVGWSGLCVHLQVGAVNAKRFGLGHYIASKIISSALMAFFAYIAIMSL